MEYRLGCTFSPNIKSVDERVVGEGGVVGMGQLLVYDRLRLLPRKKDREETNVLLVYLAPSPGGRGSD